MCREEIDVDSYNFFALTKEEITDLFKKDGGATFMTKWTRRIARVIPDGFEIDQEKETLSSRSLRKGMASGYDWLHGAGHREDLNKFAGWGRNRRLTGLGMRTAGVHYISHESWNADDEMEAAVYFFGGHARPTWASYIYRTKVIITKSSALFSIT